MCSAAASTLAGKQTTAFFLITAHLKTLNQRSDTRNLSTLALLLPAFCILPPAPTVEHTALTIIRSHFQVRSHSFYLPLLSLCLLFSLIYSGTRGHSLRQLHAPLCTHPRTASLRTLHPCVCSHFHCRTLTPAQHAPTTVRAPRDTKSIGEYTM